MTIPHFLFFFLQKNEKMSEKKHIFLKIYQLILRADYPSESNVVDILEGQAGRVTIYWRILQCHEPCDYHRYVESNSQGKKKCLLLMRSVPLRRNNTQDSFGRACHPILDKEDRRKRKEKLALLQTLCEQRNETQGTVQLISWKLVLFNAQWQTAPRKL